MNFWEQPGFWPTMVPTAAAIAAFLRGLQNGRKADAIQINVDGNLTAVKNELALANAELSRQNGRIEELQKLISRMAETRSRLPVT